MPNEVDNSLAGAAQEALLSNWPLAALAHAAGAPTVA